MILGRPWMKQEEVAVDEGAEELRFLASGIVVKNSEAMKLAKAELPIF